MRPFIKTFRSLSSFYVYDVNSNKFVDVPEESYKVFKELETVEDLSLIDAQVIKELKTLQVESKLFMDHRPDQLGFDLSREDFDQLVDTSRQQLIFNLTDVCNLNCKYCIFSDHYPYHRSHGVETIDIKTVKLAIDDFLTHSEKTETPTISFYGGEPLIAYDILSEAVDYATQKASKKIEFNMTTNGTLLTYDMIDFLVKHDMSVLVSLDGPSMVHDKMRVDKNDSPTWERIIKNLEAILWAYPDYYHTNISFRATLADQSNLDLVRAFFEERKDLFEKNVVSLGYLDTTGDFEDLPPATLEKALKTMSAYSHEYVDCLSKGKEPSKFLKALFDRDINTVHRRGSGLLEKMYRPNGICMPSVRRTFVTCSGQYSVCERVNPSLNIGNVEDGVDKEAAWNLIADYASVSSPDCTDCWAIRMCGMCFQDIYSDHIDIDKKRQSCMLYKPQLLKNFSMYCSIIEQNPTAFKALEKEAAI